MSAYIEDGSGNHENGEVRPIMTGSFHFRVCSKCSVNWVLTQNNADHTESAAVCDKCKETTSSSKTYVEIKCEDKSSLSQIDVEGGTVSTCTSSNYPHANIEKERNNNNVSDNLQRKECVYLKSPLDNIYAVPASQVMDKHSCIYLTSTESNVNYVNDMISESVAEDCQKLDLSHIGNETLLERVDAAEIARIAMISDEIIVERKVFESTLAKTSGDNDISSKKTTSGRLLGISDTLENVQDIKPEMLLRPAQYTILQSEEGSVTVGERSLLQKEEKFCTIDDDPVNDSPSNDHVSQTNMEYQYPDATLKGSSLNLILCRVDDLWSNCKPCCHQCRVCPKIFRYTSALARHKRIHIDSLQYAGKSRDRKHASQHVCSFCFQQFADRMKMMKHKRLHKPDPSERCGICPKIFRTELFLTEHYKSKHRDISSQLITCNFCPYTTNKTNSFICHVRVHTGMKPFVCTLCDRRFVNPGNLREHIKIIHRKIFKYVCSECGKGCRDKRNLKTHKRVHHSGEQMSVSTELQQTACSFCLQQFADRMEMIKHKQLHKPNPSERCGFCQKVFGTELLLRDHYRAEHRDRSSRLFTCNFCPYTTKNVEDFVCHVRVHTGVKPFLCTLCDRRFVHPSNLRKHIRIIHDKIFKYVCSECGEGCKNKINLERHKRIHHSGEQINVGAELQQTVCSFCSQQFADRMEMMKHKQLHKPDPSERCGICDKVFHTELLLRDHYRAEHRDGSSLLFTCNSCPYTTMNARIFICHERMHTGVKPYVCTQCDRRFVNPGGLREHIKFIHSKISKYVCSECGKGCRDKRNLRTHKRVHHSDEQMSVSTEQQQTACSFCFQQFADRMEMMKHMELHKPDPSEKCGICQKVFDTELLLRDHYRAEHRDGSSRLFTCNFCPYTTKNASNFICHVRMHTGVKRYVCTQCERRFVNPEGLREHIKFIHRKIFKYVCSECGKGCRDKTNLKTHKRVNHSGERKGFGTELQPTVCSFCLKQFADRMKMMKHKQLHKPDPSERCGFCQEFFDTELLLREHYRAEHRDGSSRLFICNFCPFSTKNARDFTYHVRVHTGVKPYVCTQCDGIFVSQKGLRAHVKHIHSRIFEHVRSKCDKGIRDKKKLKNHKRVHHGSKRKSFSTQLQQTRAASQTVCSFCLQQFADRMEMMKHKQLHKTDPSERCGICQKIFDTELLLRDHYRAEHRDGSSRLFTCNFCPYTNKNVNNFICHVRSHTAFKPYVCTLCDRRFVNSGVLREHVKFLHSKVFKYVCSECSKGFRNKINLEWHKSVHHVGEQMSGSTKPQLTVSASLHVCSFCFQQFTDRMEMIKHQKLHRTESDEKCDICQEMFDTELLLREHFRGLHRDRTSRLFTCHICPYTTKNAHDFISHLRMHTGVKPYVCTQCDRRFVNSGNLREHIKFIHSKIFKYACSECGKGCRDERNLRVHKRVHHSSEQISVGTELQQTVCSFCFQRFADRMEMIKHMQLHKPDPNENWLQR